MEHDQRRFASVEMVDAGWRAVYQRGSEFRVLIIAAWAVVEALEKRMTRGDRVGLVIKNGRIAFADRVTIRGARFCGYLAPDVDLESFERTKNLSRSSERRPDPREKSWASSWFG